MEKDRSSVTEPLKRAVLVETFRSEVNGWAQRIGVEPKEIRLRSMKRKWASCSSSGRLTFDTSLLQQGPHFRAEVIAHELLHLKVPNHGQRFRSLLRSYRAPGQGRLSMPSPGAQSRRQLAVRGEDAAREPRERA